MHRHRPFEHRHFQPTNLSTSQKRQVLAATQRRFLHTDRCLTSPALRARQTAEALQLDATVEPILRDCDYGRWAGLSFAHVQAQEPAALADWMRDPAAAPHGGEAILSIIKRVGAWLDAQSGLPGKTVAITHASVIRADCRAAVKARFTVDRMADRYVSLYRSLLKKT